MDYECPACFDLVGSPGDLCSDCQHDEELHYCEAHGNHFRGQCQHCLNEMGQQDLLRGDAGQ